VVDLVIVVAVVDLAIVVAVVDLVIVVAAVDLAIVGGALEEAEVEAAMPFLLLLLRNDQHSTWRLAASQHPICQLRRLVVVVPHQS